jgi:hypothetical protein
MLKGLSKEQLEARMAERKLAALDREYSEGTLGSSKLTFSLHFSY